VLLYTYAHSPRGAERDDDQLGDSDSGTNPWANSGGRDSSARMSRRGSAAQIGYNMNAKKGERARALCMRISDRKEKERTAAGWEQTVSGGSAFSCDSSGKCCEWAAQISVPLCILGFVVCFWVASLGEDVLEFDFVTDIPCIEGVLCPAIRPPPVSCAATILRNTGRTVGTDLTENDFSACGDFRTSLWGLYVGIWDSELGYQHVPTTCTTDPDTCPMPGPACYEGECRPGPIILGASLQLFFVRNSAGGHLRGVIHCICPQRTGWCRSAAPRCSLQLF
jgi:hypothetical protein